MLFIASPPPQPDNSFTYFLIGLICTILGTVLGVIVSLLIARKQRIRKELAYEIVSDAPIANINEEVKDKIEVLFEGQPVKDMSLVVLLILNTGNRAVSISDYGKPLKFEFDRRTVKDANVLETSSKEVLDSDEMKTYLILEQESIILNPLLLNPKDSITIKALVDGLKGNIIGTARIAEGKLISLNTHKRSWFRRWIKLLTYLALLPFVAYVIFKSLNQPSHFVSDTITWNFVITQLLNLILLSIAIILFIVCVWGWIIFHGKQKKQKVIAYEVISDTPIANINEELKDKIEVLFEGQPVKDMSLLTLKIWNKGGLAVRREDYDEPIRFEFAGRSYVTGEILSKEPEEVIKAENIKDFLKTNLDGSVSLLRFLLNPQESLKLKMLVTGEGKIKGTARIVDGILTEEGEMKRLPSIRIIPNISAFIILISFIDLLIRYSKIYPSSDNGIIFNIIFFLLTIISFISLGFIVFQVINIVEAFHKHNFKLLWW